MESKTAFNSFQSCVLTKIWFRSQCNNLTKMSFSGFVGKRKCKLKSCLHHDKSSPYATSSLSFSIFIFRCQQCFSFRLCSPLPSFIPRSSNSRDGRSHFFASRLAFRLDDHWHVCWLGFISRYVCVPPRTKCCPFERDARRHNRSGVDCNS